MSIESDAECDSWRKNFPSTIITIQQRPKPTSHKVSVRESWDDEDEDEEPMSDPKLVWEQENARVPMPQIRLSTTATVSGISLPPPAAFKEPLKILKRPGGEVKSPSTLPSPNSQIAKTLQERETQYRAARERIFGDKDTGNEPLQGMGEGHHATVIREPIHTATSNHSSNNFQLRRKKDTSNSPEILPEDLKDTP